MGTERVPIAIQIRDVLNNHYWRDGKGCSCDFWAGDYNTWMAVHMVPLMTAIYVNWAAPERTGEAGLREALEQLKAECNQRYETFGAGDTQAETYLISAAYAWCAMEIERALAAAPPATEREEKLRAALHSQILFMRRYLEKLVHVPTTDERGRIVNSFAAAQIPDWAMKQQIDDCEAALSSSMPVLGSK